MQSPEIQMLIATDVPHKWSRDLPVMAEATALTLSVNAFVKHLTHRSRPAAHFCESEHAVVPCPPDTRLSFYSGHTSSAFAAAVAAGTIAELHKPDRTASPSAVAPPAAPALVAAVPVVLPGGRSAALVTVGSIGGGPCVGVHWQW